MVISIFGFLPIIKINGLTTDVIRMGAQIISEIGFIGTGTIILNKNIVTGLTTLSLNRHIYRMLFI